MYLPRLRDELERRLEAAGRRTWAQEEFKRLEGIRWTAPPPEDGYLRIKGVRVLPKRAQAVLRSLHQWRESTARALDRATFRIISNEALLALAQAIPRGEDQLRAVHGLPAPLARRYGPQLLTAIAEGLSTPLEDLPVPERQPRERPDPAQEARFERLKELRNRRAAELALEPGVICPNGALQAIARAAPNAGNDLERIAELRRWQIEALGAPAILAAAAEPAPQ
jgi:ribonuclease D